jgi:HK97 family phage prohead protease
MERRASLLELKAARSDPRGLEGHAAVFGVDTRLGDFVETIRAGAFTATLAGGADVVALIDHDPSRILGRTRSGTLQLREDARGLAFRIELPDTQAARDLLALADRGDLGGMSIGFVAREENWTGNRRELRAVELREVSVISAWPAYPQTSVEARAGDTRVRPPSYYRRRYVELLRG